MATVFPKLAVLMLLGAFLSTSSAFLFSQCPNKCIVSESIAQFKCNLRLYKKDCHVVNCKKKLLLQRRECKLRRVRFCTLTPGEGITDTEQNIFNFFYSGTKLGQVLGSDGHWYPFGQFGPPFDEGRLERCIEEKGRTEVANAVSAIPTTGGCADYKAKDVQCTTDANGDNCSCVIEGLFDPTLCGPSLSSPEQVALGDVFDEEGSPFITRSVCYDDGFDPSLTV